MFPLSSLPRIPCMIVVFCFFRITPCLTLRCWSLPNSLQPPRPSDCRYILTHLPSLHQSVNIDNDLDIARAVGPSSPFFPNADVWHDTCGMRFFTYNTSEGRLLFNSPALVVSEPGALNMWARMRADATSLIAECVDHLRVGSVWGSVNAVAYPGLAYEVTVHRKTGTDAAWRHHRHPNLDMDPHHVFLDRFSRPFYDV